MHDVTSLNGDIRFCRSASESDLAGMSRLAAGAFRSGFASFLPTAQIELMLRRFYSVEALAAGLTAGVVYDRALCDGRLQGFSASAASKSASDVWELHKLFVSGTSTGRGLGTALLERSAALGRDRGARRLVLQVNRQNFAAVRLYRKFGFHVSGHIVKPIGEGFFMDDHQMTCTLTDVS